MKLARVDAYVPPTALISMTQPDEIVDFWFNRLPDEAGTGAARKVWFIKNSAFDREIAARFKSVYEQAAAGELDHWQEIPEGALALILLLDQFPRNLFRGNPRSFATDYKALVLAQGAIARGFDQALPPVKRWFIYLPLMHSEDPAHQHRCVELFRPLRDDPDVATAYPYAEKHRDVIQQFGRFPHRNQILQRPSTHAEVEFLKQPGSSF